MLFLNSNYYKGGLSEEWDLFLLPLLSADLERQLKATGFLFYLSHYAFVANMPKTLINNNKKMKPLVFLCTCKEVLVSSWKFISVSCLKIQKKELSCFPSREKHHGSPPGKHTIVCLLAINIFPTIVYLRQNFQVQPS